tara:strand:+ start:100 stop:669 length:570 start_codon:yes stop_codon:yes gene_type:complete
MKTKKFIFIFIFLFLFSNCSDNRNEFEIYEDVIEDLDKLPGYLQSGVICKVLNSELMEHQDPFMNEEYSKFLIYYDDEGNYLNGEVYPSDDEMYMLKENVSEEIKRKYKSDLFRNIKFISSDIYWDNCVSDDDYWRLFQDLEDNIADLLLWGYISPEEICNYSGTANVAADNVLYSFNSSCRNFVRWKG